MDGGAARLAFALTVAILIAAAFSAASHVRGSAAPSPELVAGSTPNGLGALTGVYDVRVYDFAPGQGFFHCIARIDHDSVTNVLESASVCYDDFGLSDPHAEPRHSLPGEGPDLLEGPPPPPPFGWQPPSQGTGQYNPTPVGNEIATITTCFRGLGGSLGPNAIASIGVPRPVYQLSNYGYITGQIDIYPRQGSAQCQSGLPLGTDIGPWSIDLYPIADVNGPGLNHPASWRTIGDDDFDNDGCPDADELWTIKTPAAACGDDPYNGLDLSGAGTDVTGSYLLVATVTPADVCWNGSYGSPATPCAGGDGMLVPGVYHLCLLDLQQSGMAVTARIYCYVDGAGLAVNPQVAGAKTCPPALAQYCGDGLAGAAPPGRSVKPDGQINFGDIDDQHAVLGGQLNSGTGRLTLSGCIEDRDGQAALGNVYLALDVDAHTGQGGVSLHSNETQADCTSGTPAGPATAAGASLVREGSEAAQRDTDADGCPDRRELSDIRRQGGLRDPLNHYDYFNPSQDGINRVDDILGVVTQYFHDDPPGQPDYDSLTDRTAIPGANEWNAGPPNGLQRVDDILLIVKQYFDDC
jgi:hypothetical protein